MPRSLRSARAGRSVRSRASRTLTTVITPSSSTISPGVTPSPVARRRRRRRCVAPSAPSSVESEFDSSPSSEFSWVSTPSAFGLRRPRPPRRRRRLRPPRESSSSEVAALSGAAALSGTLLTTLSLTALLRAALGAFSVVAAWKIGTGIAGAFFLVLLSTASATGASTISVDLSAASDFFLLTFFTARLRGDFGSIAMAPNPLCVK